MRLPVTLALVCVLFSKALALRCYQCIPELFGHCTDAQTYCPDLCHSKTTVLSVGKKDINTTEEDSHISPLNHMLCSLGGLQQEAHLKSCAEAKRCVSGNINLGFMKMTFSSKCCSTDLCNSQKVPALPQQPPNGMKCYTCSHRDCSGTVSCEGDEHHCISTTDEKEKRQIHTYLHIWTHLDVPPSTQIILE
ncbi:hypothetical protein MHYP_G00086260 [Metynnis hypsauchen]